MASSEYKDIFQYKLIYVFSIEDETHKGLLKIGDTTVRSDLSIDQLSPNCRILNEGAKKRIDSYTSTAGISYRLLHTELAVKSVKNKNGNIELRPFRDYDVHKVLINSEIKNSKIDKTAGNEWFKIDLETAIKAIKAVKENKTNLNGSKSKKESIPIVFRPEQEEAIQRTLKQFKKGKYMLWNAKMRFGKTLTALQVIKKAKYQKTIIVTHRPVVNEGWREDFNKIFFKEDGYIYCSKKDLTSLEDILRLGEKFIYFASIQDLRGSDLVGGKFRKNRTLFDINWDLVIVDEAHEGTTTALGDEVIKNLVKEKTSPNTKFLALSGTPFNIINQYEDDSIYTWDYIMEQSAKDHWPLEHFGDSNPYSDLPKLNLYTYNLGKLLNSSIYNELLDKAFNFTEFFKVVKKGSVQESIAVNEKDDLEFKHKEDVISFLNLITKSDKNSNYPYSTPELRALFQHTLWIVPGVKEAKALKELMLQHPVFGSGYFNIVNVAGSGDEENEDALVTVKSAIEKAQDNEYTITLSCGKLTTGVTVPEWTAVFMLAGSYSTSASSYMQTIFRVQSPCKKNGKIKINCYVFDFAPDRTLKMITEAIASTRQAKKITAKSELLLKEFLNYCPVISIDGTKMKQYDTSTFMQQVKNVYADRAVRTGFDDSSIYNEELYKLTLKDLDSFAGLKAIIGAAPANHKTKEIDINKQGFSEEEYEFNEKIKHKKKEELTTEEKEKLERYKEIKNNRESAISTLRLLSVRMPLLIYGADIKLEDDFKIEDLLDDTIVDSASWEEFMPKGVTKDRFKDFIKFYDKDIFIAAGRKIRNIVKDADSLPPLERIKKISSLFSYFKNPDKETVLTPWKVVNLHMSEALGGFDFWDENNENELSNPRFVDLGNITTDTVANENVQILEINSKTGLYPLYVAYSIYRIKCNKYNEDDLTLEKQKEIWRETLQKNMFVLCKTPMAKQITQRTLSGYSNIKINAHYFENLINALKSGKTNSISSKVTSRIYWKKEGDGIMKFDAVVGNPPYQENIAGREEQPPVYHLFYELAKKLSDRVTLITPARFLFEAGKTPPAWNKLMLQDNHFKVLKYFPNEQDVFENVSIKGGVCISLYDKNQNFGAIKVFMQSDTLRGIVQKVLSKQTQQYLSELVYSNTSYKFAPLFFLEHPDFKLRVSGGSLRYLSSPSFDKFPEVFFEKEPVDEKYIKIFGRQKNERKELFFKASYLKCPNNCECYKVFIAASNGNGKLGETLSMPFIGYPNQGHTETFMTIGCFDNIIEAENLLKYLKTKFLRILLGTKKVTQGNKSAKVWSNIPVQNFTMNSDINWNCSIHEIDEMLYKKYNLTEKEIDFIEEIAKEMF